MRRLLSSRRGRQSGREEERHRESKYRKCMTEESQDDADSERSVDTIGKDKEISFDGFYFSKKIISSADNYLEEMEEGLEVWYQAGHKIC